MKVIVYCLGEKAYVALKGLSIEYIKHIKHVVIAKDKNILDDFSSEIQNWAKKYDVKFYSREHYNHLPEDDFYHIAIGWRWIIKAEYNKLIVLHDSILPKYRGFNPLVTALLNKDKEIGVTALFGAENYDEGDIIYQSIIEISYPIKINRAIKLLSQQYSKLLNKIFDKIAKKESLSSYPQIDSDATYSVWRNEEDYTIDWRDDSKFIKSLVDTLGPPYKGAKTYYNNKEIRILDVEEINDLHIEFRELNIGKNLFLIEGKPVIICGKGLLKLNTIIDEMNKQVKFKNFRIRLGK